MNAAGMFNGSYTVSTTNMNSFSKAEYARLNSAKCAHMHNCRAITLTSLGLFSWLVDHNGISLCPKQHHYSASLVSAEYYNSEGFFWHWMMIWKVHAMNSHSCCQCSETDGLHEIFNQSKAELLSTPVSDFMFRSCSYPYFSSWLEWAPSFHHL